MDRKTITPEIVTAQGTSYQQQPTARYEIIPRQEPTPWSEYPPPLPASYYHDQLDMILNARHPMATRGIILNLNAHLSMIYTARRREMLMAELARLQTTLDEIQAARRTCLTVIDGGKDAGEVGHV